ncbi:hypothetical protein AJ80_06236 [Polytolypa hystricis UAMH7299]|uniref:Phosphoribosyltransferase domain-containing protein n=1 Tax=Polytolypa hystricis (strain UAMH7299) TaxID=1447883 RepID=A0A2B7XY80_POLH7|nr:hypothetical protein AJ80_06236 [Polytolypa hystricis UAMH7299]
MSNKVYVTYNQVHKLCQASADKILNEFNPNLMIAIGGGGYVPARILRSFLKRPGSHNIPIQAIGLSLYEDLGKDGVEEEIGTKVTRTQWLDLSSLEMANLIGKNVLIVDEVDDTRTTLEYAVRELEKDVELAQQQLGRTGEKTTFSIFVLHNKNKEKKGKLPADMLEEKRYHAAVTTEDVWICYPWEAKEIVLRGHSSGHRTMHIHQICYFRPKILLLIADFYYLNRDIEEHDKLAAENPLL